VRDVLISEWGWLTRYQTSAYRQRACLVEQGS
jgi:hypothetical protein